LIDRSIIIIMAPAKRGRDDDLTDNHDAVLALLLARKKKAAQQAIAARHLLHQQQQQQPPPEVMVTSRNQKNNKKRSTTTPVEKSASTAAAEQERVTKRVKRPPPALPKKMTDDDAFFPTASSEEDDDEEPPAENGMAMKKRRQNGGGTVQVYMPPASNKKKQKPHIAAAVAAAVAPLSLPPLPQQAPVKPFGPEPADYVAFPPVSRPLQVPNHHHRRYQQAPSVARQQVVQVSSRQLASAPVAENVTDEEEAVDLSPHYDLEVVRGHEEGPLLFPPKQTSKVEFFLMVTYFLAAVVAVLFARKAITPSFWLGALFSTPCPPGGRCSKGELSECRPYLTVYDGACILNETAAVKIEMIDELLHKYSQEHIGRTTVADANPYFAREEQGRPLFYLTSVTKVLEIQGGADVELLDAANVQEDKFLVVMSDGLLVGVHPSRFIPGGAYYANARFIIRKVARIMAHFVWSVIVTCCSWLIQDTFWTLWYTGRSGGRPNGATYRYRTSRAVGLFAAATWVPVPCIPVIATDTTIGQSVSQLERSSERVDVFAATRRFITPRVQLIFDDTRGRVQPV
jgi:hypothetical protein